MTSSSTFSSKFGTRAFWTKGWGVLVLFAMACVLTDAALGIALDGLFRKVSTGEGAGITRGILAQAKRADVLILGSSRARHHIDPKVLEQHGIADAFNGGINGQGIPAIAALSALIVEQASVPSSFVLVVDPRELLSPEPARVALFAPFFGEIETLDQQLESQIEWGFLKLRSNAFRYNSKVLPLLRNALAPGSIGYEGLPGSLTEIPTAEPPRGRQVDQSTLRLYENTLRRLRRAEVNVLTVVGPRLWPQAKISRAAQADLEAATLRAGATFCPMVEMGGTFQTPQLYRDPHHLNRDGAARFSAELAKVLSRVRVGKPACPDESMQ